MYPPSLAAAMVYSFTEKQIRKLCGFSSYNGIWLSDGMLEIGEKTSSFFRSHIITIFGCILGCTGALNTLLFPWWELVFFQTDAGIFPFILFIVHLLSFDFFIGILLLTFFSAVFLPQSTKQFHALEHKMLDLMKSKKPVTLENLMDAKSTYKHCGITMISLYTLFFCFFTFIPIVFGVMSQNILSFSEPMVYGIFCFLVVFLFVEYHTAYFGIVLQRYFFTAEPTLPQLRYGLRLCQKFFRKQYSAKTQKELKILREICQLVV